MKITPLELEFDYWKLGNKDYHTARISLLSIDTYSTYTALLDIGWYQGEFEWEILFLNMIQRKLEEIFNQ